jgi:heme/copper-type cytochrome/quinol oxidase subunit 2
MGRVDDAAGALLLFSTNFAAIVVVACIVFILCGARPSPDHVDERRRLRVGLAVASVALVLVAIPLAWETYESVEAQLTAIDGAPIDLVVAGSTIPYYVPALASSLATTLGHPVDLTVVYVPRVRVRAVAD